MRADRAEISHQCERLVLMRKIVCDYIQVLSIIRCLLMSSCWRRRAVPTTSRRRARGTRPEPEWLVQDCEAKRRCVCGSSLRLDRLGGLCLWAQRARTCVRPRKDRFCRRDMLFVCTWVTDTEIKTRVLRGPHCYSTSNH